MTRPRVIVIGAGAGGMMAAGRAAERGARVLLLEKMPVSGKKILISGKTRCNVTNARSLEEFIPMYGPNGRFLHSAFHRYFRNDLLALLRRYGVATKTERGGRVFPDSDDAADVVGALDQYMSDGGVEVLRARATAIEVRGGKVTGVRTDHGALEAEAVVLATGGASYPETGSTGDGFRIARALGHAIVKLRPALVPLMVHESKLAADMQGVSLRNVRLTAYACPAGDLDRASQPTEDCGRGTARPRARKPVIESRMGEMMMTHFGIGGPIVLLMSLAVVDALETGPVSVAIDLKPALSEEKLDRRIQRDLAGHGRRGFRHILAGLLPRKLIDPYLVLTGIPADKRANQIGADERKRLVDRLKSLRFTIRGPRSMDCAIVTAGGVSLKEVDPRTMASRLVKGLYFCGEVMDLDADTGGYNLQAAFSTGHVAGDEAAG